MKWKINNIPCKKQKYCDKDWCQVGGGGSCVAKSYWKKRKKIKFMLTCVYFFINNFDVNFKRDYYYCGLFYLEFKLINIF
jgi:hypothetical protein